eukprot:TRINITY_DN8011_c0_g1_i1.p4 TRINITY_DN8011_c0_g1~~TRINITY_DN8011_c0_g1_i1.p4  ORF type:complete len:113 (-),score=6.91 TRINITY_DN8011_c0_g1_i1:304-642(-)
MVNAWFDQITLLCHAVERANRHSVETAMAVLGDAMARAIDEGDNFERFRRHLAAVQPEVQILPTRFNAQGILGRRAHADRGDEPYGSHGQRSQRARSYSHDSERGAASGSRR